MLTWTDWHDQILTKALKEKGYTRAVCAEVGATLGRSAKSCENRARRLGIWPLQPDSSWTEDEDLVLVKALEWGGTSAKVFRSVSQQLSHRSWKACQQRAMRLGLYQRGFSAWTAERRQDLAEWMKTHGRSEESIQRFLEAHELTIALESAIQVAEQLSGGALPPHRYYSVQEIATAAGVRPNQVYKRAASWPKLLQWRPTARSARVFWSIDALPPDWRAKIEGVLPSLPQPVVPPDLQGQIDRLPPVPREVALALLDSCAPVSTLPLYLSDAEAQRKYARLAPHYREVARSIVTYDYEAFGRYCAAALQWAAAPAEVWPDSRPKSLKDSDRQSSRYHQDPETRARRKAYDSGRKYQAQPTWKASNTVFFDPKPKFVWL